MKLEDNEFTHSFSFCFGEGTTITDAISKFEKKSKIKAAEAVVVKLNAQYPPIYKMDDSLSVLTNCRELSLAINAIENIEHLHGLTNLKILALGRNQIRSLRGVEAVAETLEELWISYNIIETLDGIESLKKLRVLYMAHNFVKTLDEIVNLDVLPVFENLMLEDNPVEEDLAAKDMIYRYEVIKILTRLKELDGVPVSKDDDWEE